MQVSIEALGACIWHRTASQSLPWRTRQGVGGTCGYSLVETTPERAEDTDSLVQSLLVAEAMELDVVLFQGPRYS